MTAQLTAEQIDDFQLAWGNAFGKNNDLFARLCALAKANLTAGKPATISMISDWGTDLKNLPAGSNRELVAWWEQAMRYHYQVVQAEYPRDAQQAEIKLRNHLGAIPVTIPPGYTVVKLKDLRAAPSLEDRRTHPAPPAHITAEIQPWEFTKDTLDKATADLFLRPAPPAEDAPEPEHGWWSFMRSVLEQGRGIQQDYLAGRHATYEHLCARVDEAAREREDELRARLANQKGKT